MLLKVVIVSFFKDCQCILIFPWPFYYIQWLFTSCICNYACKLTFFFPVRYTFIQWVSILNPQPYYPRILMEGGTVIW